MAGPTRQSAPTRVLIVEDRVETVHVLLDRIQRLSLDGSRSAETVGICEHQSACQWDWDGAPVDVVLLDAYRHLNAQRADPTLSIFGGLDVAAAISVLDHPPRIVGYSAAAREPEVNIPFREFPVVVALYYHADLVEYIEDALWSEEHPRAVPQPTSEDYQRLGVMEDAQIWTAIQLMLARPATDEFPRGDAWETVAQTQPVRATEARTREYINDYVRPWLGVANYREVRTVLQRVTRLPIQSH